MARPKTTRRRMPAGPSERRLATNRHKVAHRLVVLIAPHLFRLNFSRRPRPVGIPRSIGRGCYGRAGREPTHRKGETFMRLKYLALGLAAVIAAPGAVATAPAADGIFVPLF